MDFLMSFIKNRHQPVKRQFFLTMSFSNVRKCGRRSLLSDCVEVTTPFQWFSLFSEAEILSQ